MKIKDLNNIQVHYIYRRGSFNYDIDKVKMEISTFFFSLLDNKKLTAKELNKAIEDSELSVVQSGITTEELQDFDNFDLFNSESNSFDYNDLINLLEFPDVKTVESFIKHLRIKYKHSCLE